MDADEIEIVNYLQTWGNQYVSTKEICRRANKRRFSQDNYWAQEPLARLKDNGIVESDARGRYRLKPEAEEEGAHVAGPADLDALSNEDGEEPRESH
jgi:DNA-binding IclR family transcriptional regulator